MIVHEISLKWFLKLKLVELVGRKGTNYLKESLGIVLLFVGRIYRNCLAGYRSTNIRKVARLLVEFDSSLP